MIRPGTDPQAIVEAARRIQAGELVGFPTETVYGLGADASSDAAVAGIFAAKGRPADHPLIVHVADAARCSDYASSVPPFAARLMQAFWPGPLTVILPRREGVALAAAGGPGLDWPALPGASGGAGFFEGLWHGRGRAEREPLWPRQPDHRAACRAGVWRRAAGARRRRRARSASSPALSIAPGAGRCCCAPAC